MCRHILYMYMYITEISLYVTLSNQYHSLTHKSKAKTFCHLSLRMWCLSPCHTSDVNDPAGSIVFLYWVIILDQTCYICTSFCNFSVISSRAKYYTINVDGKHLQRCYYLFHHYCVKRLSPRRHQQEILKSILSFLCFVEFQKAQNRTKKLK